MNILLIQVIFILFVLFAVSRAYLRYKEGKIKSLEFLFWVVVWAGAAVALLLPETVAYISTLLGIGRPVDLVIYVAIALLFYLNFRTYVAIDAVEEKITKAVREVAIERSKKK